MECRWGIIFRLWEHSSVDVILFFSSAFSPSITLNIWVYRVWNMNPLSNSFLEWHTIFYFSPSRTILNKFRQCIMLYAIFSLETMFLIKKISFSFYFPGELTPTRRALSMQLKEKTILTVTLAGNLLCCNIWQNMWLGADAEFVITLKVVVEQGRCRCGIWDRIWAGYGHWNYTQRVAAAGLWLVCGFLRAEF